MKEINESLIKEFIDKKNIFSVVGVSENSEKFGNKVYFDLKNAGYLVYAINPRLKKINGDNCYPDLRSLPKIPDVVDIVVPPRTTEKIVIECIFRTQSCPDVFARRASPTIPQCQTFHRCRCGIGTGRYNRSAAPLENLPTVLE